MTALNSAGACAAARSRADGLRSRLGIDRVPDRRGEALDIFQTIFIRPALDLGPPVARMARHVWRDARAHPRTPIGQIGFGPVENRT